MSAARLVELRDRLERVLEQRVDVRELARDALLRHRRRSARRGRRGRSSRRADRTRAGRCRCPRGSGRAASTSRGRSARSAPRSRWPARAPPARAPAPGRRPIGEAAQPVELVDQRDRIDRLTLGVQPERGSIDRPVGLAVEVACVEDLPLTAPIARGEHHRPEHGLLGIEVLGGTGAVARPGVRAWAGCAMRGVVIPRPSLKPERVLKMRCFGDRQSSRPCGRTEHMFVLGCRRNIRSLQQLSAQFHKLTEPVD